VYDPHVTGARDLLPYGAKLPPPAPDMAHSEGQKRLFTMCWATCISAIFTIPVVVLSWADTPVPVLTRQIISLVLATIVQGIAVPEFYIGAIKSLVFSKVIEMDMLVVISITAAYGYSVVAFALAESGIELEQEAFFETSSLLITLVLLGRLISAFARMRAVSAVSMSSLQAEKALLLRTNGNTEEIDARLLQIGDIVRVMAHTSVVTYVS
jgi:Cd2+-exporting ATPase